MPASRFAFLGNNEIHVQECRWDFIASCWVMSLDSAVGTVIHDFGGAEDPRALQPCDKHCTTTPGSETCSVLLHVAVLQGQASLFCRIEVFAISLSGFLLEVTPRTAERNTFLHGMSAIDFGCCIIFLSHRSCCSHKNISWGRMGLSGRTIYSLSCGAKDSYDLS